MGKIKEDYIQQGVREFERRLTPYCQLQTVEVSDGPNPRRQSHALREEVKEREGERILKALEDGGYHIALDSGGKPITSEGLSISLDNLQKQGYSKITFVIGGAFGLSARVLDSVHYTLSLSHLTFTHEMVRLLFLEQLYRAFKISRNEPYHY